MSNIASFLSAERKIVQFVVLQTRLSTDFFECD